MDATKSGKKAEKEVRSEGLNSFVFFTEICL